MQINCAPAETIYSGILRLISRRHGGCVEARGLMLKYYLTVEHTYARAYAHTRTRYVFHEAKKNAAIRMTNREEAACREFTRRSLHA